MGQSTDGILFYGYAWTNEDADLLRHHKIREDQDLEWPEILAKVQGIKNPWDAYYEAGINDLPYEEQNAAYEAFKTPEWNAEVDAWYDIKREIEKKSPVSIGHHCSGDYPLPYVYIKSSEVQNSRGYAEEVDVLGFALAPLIDWNTALDAFIEDLGISLEAPEYGDPPKGPGWFLVSYWG